MKKSAVLIILIVLFLGVVFWAALRADDEGANARVYDVSGQGLDGALPAEIRHMTSLEILDASDNDLTGIPAEIGQLSNLREIDFSNNHIDTMPNEIVNLKKLETLNLSGNPYSPEEIARIRSMLPWVTVLF